MEFWKELFLSAIKGLTSLNYTRQRLPRNIFPVLLIGCIFMQDLIIYQLGYKNCQAHILNDFAKQSSRPGPSKRKKNNRNFVMKSNKNPRRKKTAGIPE
jgi:hypothetical protein